MLTRAVLYPYPNVVWLSLDLRLRMDLEMSLDFSNERLLVVSAHAADLVWRAVGAIALYASRGARVRVLCLSYGERGESQGLWKKESMTLEHVKQIRHEEATKAAETLGAEIRCFDAGDYPLRPTDALVEGLVQEVPA